MISTAGRRKRANVGGRRADKTRTDQTPTSSRPHRPPVTASYIVLEMMAGWVGIAYTARTPYAFILRKAPANKMRLPIDD